MEIRKSPTSAFQFAYDIWCNSVISHGEENFGNPFALTRCRIDPCSESSCHAHDDEEIFVIEQGGGSMTIGCEQQPVSTGDVILIPKNNSHTLKNLSSSEPLFFYSISWLSPKPSSILSHSLVIAAPPTPNGPLHLGHLSGPYLAADIFRRYQRLHGGTTQYVLGTDDNQCYITNKARALGIDNQDVLARFKPAIKSALTQFSAQPDELIEPENNLEYTRFITEFFRSLVQKNVIEKRSAKTVYCHDAQKFIFGADVIGQCPQCKKTTSGHGCEQCGHYNDCHDLLNIRSVYGSTPVSIKTVDRYYVSLARHEKFLTSMIDSCSMHPRLKYYYLDYLTHLPDVSASHVSSWGIKNPLTHDQIIYEWVEMAGAYAYYLTRAQRQFDCSWSSLHLIESFGFDNSFFYGLLVPVLINEYDQSLPQPSAFLCNFFYLLNDEKFSTSRNHAIWAHEFLDHHPADHVRFYVALTRGENAETNFCLDHYTSFTERVVTDSWYGFLNALNNGIALYPEAFQKTPRLLGYQERFLEDSKRMLNIIHEAMGPQQFSLNAAARTILRLQEDMDSFHQRVAANQVDYPTNLAVLVAVARAWACALAPIMPTFVNAILPRTHLKKAPSLKDLDTFGAFDLSWFTKPQGV